MTNIEQRQRLQNIFFFSLLGIVCLFALLIFWPFLLTLALAAMFAVLLLPVYKKIKLVFGGSRNIASLITVLLLIVVIVIPVFFMSSQIVREAQGIYTSLFAGGSTPLDYFSNKINVFVHQIDPTTTFTFDIRAYTAGIASWMASWAGNIFSKTLSVGGNLALALVALFYILRDNEKIKVLMLGVSPLPEDEDQMIVKSVKGAINSVILGSIIIGIIQGILAGIGFWIFGVPNPALWGTFAAVASLVPAVGTGLVWVPATIYLLAFGGAYMWIGELIWSVVLIAIVDNFVAPLIFKRGMDIHPLLILFAILGGVVWFGPEGVLIGPLVLSLLAALIKVYQNKYAKA